MRHRLLAFLLLALPLGTLAHCGGDPAEARDQGTDARPDAPSLKRDAQADAEPEIDDGPATEGGGTRFKPLYYVTTYEDGTKERELRGFQDTLLGERCHVSEVGPDVYACVPSLGMGSGVEAFADPSCTEPVIALNQDPALGFRYAALEESLTSTTCGSTFVKVPQSTTRGSAYRRYRSGECELIRADAFLVPMSAIIPPSEFGVFTRTKDTTAFPLERNGTRLTLESWRLTGDDGSFTVLSPRIVDLARGSAGTISLAMDRSLRFLPSSAIRTDALSNRWGDATCTTPVMAIEKPSKACHEDPFASKDVVEAQSIEPGCTGMRAFRAPASPPLAGLYMRGVNGCSGDYPYEWWLNAYPSQQLEELPVDTFMEISQRLVPNTRRTISGSKLEARAVVHSSSDGLEFQEREWKLYLRGYDVPCRPDYHADSLSQLCIPDVPFSGAYFADATCTVPVLRLVNPVPNCEAPTIYRFWDGSGQRVFKRAPLPPLELTTAYSKGEDGVCGVADINDSPIAYYPPGVPEEIPVTEFPVLESYEEVIGE